MQYPVMILKKYRQFFAGNNKSASLILRIVQSLIIPEKPIVERKLFSAKLCEYGLCNMAQYPLLNEY